MYSRNLSDLNEFPLSFKFCIEELTNVSDRYKKFGYNTVYAFFQGKIDYFDGEWVGWAGHGEGNETLASVKGKNLYDVKIVKSCSKSKSKPLSQQTPKSNKNEQGLKVGGRSPF